MPKASGTKRKPIRIGLLGASFDTGNLGVSTLAECSIKIILNRWPYAEIILLGSGYTPQQQHLSIMGREISIKTLPIRFSKNIFLPYHFLWFVFYGLLVKLLPKSRLKEILVSHNQYFKLLFGTDIVVDITGGDSFSDTYGFPRFFLGFLRKWLVLLFNKDLIMLPQTYGPFRRPLAKVMARYVLRHASAVYSRDRDGLQYVKKLVGNNTMNSKVRFAPDVAFVLDSREPEHLIIEPSIDIRPQDSIVVGLNVSGLLFNGGYTRDNMFDLKDDYRELIYAVIETLLEDENIVVLLVPHVFPPSGCEVESDPDACLRVYEQLKQKHSGRVFLVKGEYDQGEIKYVIGLCDFFIGSRMHSCIAALSQCIPAVGLAYSKKFNGVFETVRAGQYVIDLRQKDRREIIESIMRSFKQRNTTAENLKVAIPKAQKRIRGVF